MYGYWLYMRGIDYKNSQPKTDVYYTTKRELIRAIYKITGHTQRELDRAIIARKTQFLTASNKRIDIDIYYSNKRP